MFSVVAMESRTFFSFPCLANKHLFNTCEGAQPGS